jgi:hypothetical protein
MPGASATTAAPWVTGGAGLTGTGRIAKLYR